ncbi:MAG: hypothetical protein JWS12_793 [Candidatus Saccharibacteria bacterium]|nr:hypothetical protein [Candidatus Saccharibacteria bacterium]
MAKKQTMKPKSKSKSKKKSFNLRAQRKLLGVIFVLLVALIGVYLLTRGKAITGTPEKFGVNVGHTVLYTDDTALFNKEMDDFKTMGVRWLRADFSWSVLQPSPTSYNLAKQDRFVNAAYARGLKVLGIIDYTPQWATLGGSSSDKTEPADDKLDDYANFAGTLASRYKGKVDAWEIWNEPNGKTFWSPKPNPVKYTAMLKLAYTSIHAANSSATVMTGGPQAAYTDPVAATISPIDWLSAIYSNGGKGYFDAVAWHPYTDNYTPPGATGDDVWSSWRQAGLSQPKSAVSIMAANGDSAKKVWGTEDGAYTANGSHPLTEVQQASYLTATYNLWQGYSWSGPLFWYSYHDQGDNFGLKNANDTPKLAYQAYINAVNATLPPPPPSDTQAPTNVAVAVPTANSTVSGKDVVLSSSALDNVAVTKLEYYRDSGQYIGLGAYSAQFGYYYHWDSTTVNDGTYKLYAKAYDAANNVTASPTIALNVKNTTPPPSDTTPPTASIATPSTGTSVSGTTVLSSAASDNVGVTKVDYIADTSTTPIGIATPSVNYGWFLNWDTLSVGNGRHTITARAYDQAGNVGKSATITLVVNNIVPDTQPPSSPTITGTDKKARSFTLTWSASSDNVGLSRYQVYVNTQLVGQTTATTFTIDNLARWTTYSVKIVAVDTAGNQSLPTSITLQTRFIRILWFNL